MKGRRKFMRLQNSIIRCVVLAVAISTLATLAGMQIGCTTSQPMLSATEVPASKGTVSATKGKNDNTNVTIRVKHLAPASKISPEATTYVVWIEPRNGAMQNVGAMILDKNLVGVFNTVTPHRRFKVSVTPEPSGKVAQPTHEPVFTSEVERTE
jgi:hypothetical protein